MNKQVFRGPQKHREFRSMGGVSALANGKPCGGGHIADDKECGGKGKDSGKGDHKKSSAYASLMAAGPKPKAKAPAKGASAVKSHKDVKVGDHLKLDWEDGDFKVASNDPKTKTLTLRPAGSSKGRKGGTYRIGYDELTSGVSKRNKNRDTVRYSLLAQALLRNREFQGKLANRGNDSYCGGKPCLINKVTGKNTFQLPGDGWYQITPKGQFTHRESGTEQLIDDASIAAMLNRFRKESEAPNFPGVLVDYDHFSLDSGQKSEAAGWITNMQQRPSGLWAQIRWTNSGLGDVKGGKYRLVSPVWLRDEMEDAGDGRLRPLRLDSLALTNDPNLKGMMPLSNSNNGSTSCTCGASKPPVRNQNTMDFRILLLSMLGLPPEATDPEIQSAVDATMANMVEDPAAPKPGAPPVAPIGAVGNADPNAAPGKLDPNDAPPRYPTANEANKPDAVAPVGPGSTESSLATMPNMDDAPDEEEFANMDEDEKDNAFAEMKHRATAQRRELIESDLIEFASVIQDPNAVRSQLMANRQTTRALLAGLKPARKSGNGRPSPLFNRNRRPNAPHLTKDVQSEGARTQASTIANRTQQIQKDLQVPYRRAFAMAQKETTTQL